MLQAGAAPEPAELAGPAKRHLSCPPYTVTTFDRTSLTNVEEESRKLWVYIIGIYAIAILVLSMLWMHYRQSISWRILYLSWLRRGDSGHTVLVTDIPSPAMPSTKGLVPKLLGVCFSCMCRSQPFPSLVRLCCSQRFVCQTLHQLHWFTVSDVCSS